MLTLSELRASNQTALLVLIVFIGFDNMLLSLMKQQTVKPSMPVIPCYFYLY